MNAFLRLAAICSALSLGFVGASLQAQQTSVPPAPPPDMQSTPSVPPPFPPMPAREPRHRFVDMGGHHTSHSGHHSTRSSHHATKSSHHSTRHSSKARHHETHARHTSKHSRHEAAPKLSKKQIRQCKKMNYSQLLKHHNCAALLQSELKSESRSTHRSHSSKAAKHKKNEHHRTTSHKTSVRRHRH